MQLLGLNSKGSLVEVKDVRSFLKEKGNLLWINIQDPKKSDTDFLTDLFSFHPLTIEDIIKPNRLPKVDEFEDYLFIIFHKVKFLEKEDQFRLEELNICLGRNYIVTAHMGRSTTIESVIEKIKKNPGLMKRGSDFVLYEILNTVVDKYFKILDTWDDEIDYLEDSILKGKTNGCLNEFIRLKKDLNRLKRILAPQRELVNKFARKDFPFISEKSAIYFRDLYDHLFRQQTILEEYRDLVTGVFEAYLSIISNRLNEVMKQLTILSTIFLPLTFIVGVYGMNFKFMPELEIKEAYFVLWGIMIVIALGMVYYFKKKKWI